MNTFAQLLVAGIITGTIYAFIAAGYAIIYTATGVVNFALGAQAMVAGYVAYVLFDDQSLVVAIVASVVVSVLVAAASWAWLYRRTAERDLFAAIIMSFGFSIILQEAVGVIAGPTPHPAASPFGSGTVEWSGVTISRHGVGVLVVGTVLLTAIVLVFRSHHGVAVRAMFQDRDMAEMLGVRTRRLTLALIAVSGVVVAAAGISAGPLLSMSPTMGTRLALIAFVGAILGGLGRLGTAIAGALLLGVLEAMFGGYVSADYRTTLVFGVFVIVLIARPAGVFGIVAKVKV